MENTPVSIAVCNQKGGVGKSTFTVLLASHLHYTLQRDVLVVDCDYPQWSIYNQRTRELEILNLSDYYKLMVARQFKGTDRKFWPIVSSSSQRSISKRYRTFSRIEYPASGLQSHIFGDDLHVAHDRRVKDLCVVPRHVDVGMTEHLGDVVDRCAAGQRQGGERMARTM